MLHITASDEVKGGTCIICTSPIVIGKDYWRCLDAVCGDAEGPGRVCHECYPKVQVKDRCVACNRPLEENFISDPKLLQAAIDTDGSSLWMNDTMRKLILEGKHFDTVLGMALRNASVLCHLATFAVSTWHLLPLEQLQRLYSALETAIMYRLAVKPVNLWTATVFEAVGKCDVSVVEWLIQWMEQRCIFHEVTPTTELGLGQEARLLSLCETKEEFKAFRRLLGGPRNDIIRGDVFDKYMDIKGDGQEWAMRSFLDTFAANINNVDPNQLEQRMVHRLLRKFPCEEMYRWAQKLRMVIGGCDPVSIDLALKYNLFPVVYGCHAKGLYSQSAALALRPISYDAKNMEHGNWTVLPDVHPETAKRVLYVDLSRDSMKLDWHTVHDLKTLDATSKRVTVEVCGDGVEIHVGQEQLLCPDNVPFKLVKFDSLALKQRTAPKRKFLSIDDAT